MPKYKDGFYIQFPRSAFKELAPLKTSSKWLYVVLSELEHQFTSKKKDYFYRSIKNLCEDSGLGKNTVINGLRELQSCGLIEKWYSHFQSEKTKSGISDEHITTIRIMKLDAEFNK